jgi:ribonuclease J
MPSSPLLAEDGDVIHFGPAAARKVGSAAAGRTLLDRSGTSGLDDAVIRDRRHLSSEGIVVPIVVLDKQTGRVESPPEIVTRGFVGSQADLIEDATRLVFDTVAARPPEECHDPSLIRERLRLELRRFFRKRTHRRPMVIPVVMEV